MSQWVDWVYYRRNVMVDEGNRFGVRMPNEPYGSHMTNETGVVLSIRTVYMCVYVFSITYNRHCSQTWLPWQYGKDTLAKRGGLCFANEQSGIRLFWELYHLVSTEFVIQLHVSKLFRFATYAWMLCLVEIVVSWSVREPLIQQMIWTEWASERVIWCDLVKCSSLL